ASRPGLRRPRAPCSLPCSQCESSFTGTVGHCGHATLVGVAAAVEDHGLDAGGLRALSDELADAVRLGGLVVARRAEVLLHRRCGCDRAALHIVDDLDEHVARRARDHEARALGGAVDVLAQTSVTTRACSGLALAEALLLSEGHVHLPAFPTLRRTFSPA